MAIEWTAQLETGIREIDDQHKELFYKIGLLHEACRIGRGKDMVGDMLEFLEEYALTHFDTEEKYMSEYDYQDYYHHKDQHTEFIRNIIMMKQEYAQEGPGLHLVIRINLDLAQWLEKHIKGLDKALGAFIAANATA